MAQTPTKEGYIPFHIPAISTPCSTYYKIFGTLSPTSPTLIVLHGGPGAGHEYMLPFADIWPRCRIPVIFYDHIGCAASTHLPQHADDKSLWREELFLSELDNLIDHFHLPDGAGFDLLGHSFGGSMVAAYATRQPKGLRRLVIASGLASKRLSIKGRNLRRKDLPAEVQKILDEGDAKGETETEEYKEAMGVYSKSFLCRIEPFPPPEMMSALKNTGDFKAIENTMNGSSRWESVGTMENWTCIPGLPNIEVPTLVYNGEFDTSHDIATVPFFELIPRVRWITFANAGHSPHIEGDVLREKTLKLVGDFLTQEKSWK